jgi:flagellar hook-length control protein FliK
LKQEDSTKLEEYLAGDGVTDEDVPLDAKPVAGELMMETVKATTVGNSSDDIHDEKGNDDLIANQAVSKTVDTQEKVKVEVDVSSEHKEFQQKEEKDTPLFEQLVDNISNAKVVQNENVQERVEVTQQMREIVEQVIETIKVTVTADTSEMSIQLNPENLGKVNLSVVAKEGHITAQFVTENEMAKHALEAQIQQLKETLTEQGLKVDKVEVSVSDFSFQQGSQASAEEQKENQRNEHAKQVHRSLNLADINDISDLTEEEELAVKIMRINGGQVDYIA